MTIVFASLVVILILLTCVVRRIHVKHGPTWSTEWRRCGRDWATVGEQERSDWCHRRADYFALPWWLALLTPVPDEPPPPFREPKS